jgi:HSP20 family protein
MATVNIQKNDPPAAPKPAQIVRGQEPGWEPFRMMRDLLAWDPFREMAPYRTPPLSTFMPTFEVKETKDGYVFKADVPGMKESDIDVSLTGNRLTISGKRDEEKKQETDTYYTYERSYGSFTRSFTLPEGIEASTMGADLKDGVLTIEVKKTPEAQPKKIPIQTAAKKV